MARSGTILRQDASDATPSLLVTPILIQGRIVAVAGVEDKPEPYQDRDTRCLIRLMDAMWRKIRTKQMDAALRESESRFRRIVETANEGIIVTDQAFNTVYVNPTLCDMLGRPAEELLGRGLAFVIHPHELQDHEIRMANRLQGVSEKYERRLLTSQGEVLWTLFNATPLYDDSGQFQGTFATISDLTGRKNLERRLIREVRRSGVLEELARLSLEADSVDSIAEIALSIALRFTDSPQGYVGYIDPATGHLVCPTLTKDTRQEGAGECDTPVFNKFTGLWGWVLVHKKPLLTNAPAEDPRSSGLPPGHAQVNSFLSVPALHGQELAGQIAVMNAKRDYTREDLQFLERLASILALGIRRKMAEEALTKAKESAEAANRAKNAFMATMSHELRTPLNGTLGMLQLLQSTALSDEQQEYLAIALDTGRHLTQLIADILDITMIETRSLALMETNFNLGQALTPMLDAYARQATQKGLDLQISLAPDVPRSLRGDEGRIRQILFNLLGNAMKFTALGSVRLDVQAVPKPDGKQCWLIFTVQDTGIGLPEDKAEQLFEPFTQLDGSRTRAFGGVGLGLTLVKRLVELMQGAITVDSNQGQGSTFACSVLVGLPDGSQPAPVVESPRGSCPLPTRTIRVLLVEDDIINRLATEHLLLSLSHQVIAAENGKAALELLRTENVDVIIMDLRMPIMDGLHATRIIRTDPAYKAWAKIPIVALTAHALPDDQEACRAAGMNAFLTKPYDMMTLLRALSNAMQRPLAIPPANA